MVVSKRSRIKVRKAKPTKNVHSDHDGDEDKESESITCGDDGESALSSTGGITKSIHSASDHMAFPSAESIESNRRGKMMDADPQRRRSSELSDNTEKHSNSINQEQNSVMTQLSSFFVATEKEASLEELNMSRKRMRSNEILSGVSKRSKLPSSDDCTHESIENNARVIEGIYDKTSHILSNSFSAILGVNEDSTASRKLDVVMERSPPHPQRDDSQFYDKGVENGAPHKFFESTAAMTEVEEHIPKSDRRIFVPCSSDTIKGESVDVENPRALVGSDSLICTGNFHIESVGSSDQIALGASTQVAMNATLSTSNVIIEEHRHHAGELPETSTARADVYHASVEICESNETGQKASQQSISQSPGKEKHDNIDNETPGDKVPCETGTSRESTPADTECRRLGGIHGRVNDIHKAPSVSQLKIALFLEASKAHCFGNCAVRKFANYWDTLGKYLSLDPQGVMKRVRPDLRSRAGIDSILSDFLKTRRMKLLHNKLILSIMSEAMKTHVPAQYFSHVPRQWKLKTTHSVRAQEKDGVEMNYYDQSKVIPHWNANFGPYSGTWTAHGGDITLSKTDCSNSIVPELVGSIRSGDLAEESIFPSCRLPGALDIDPLVRKLTSRSGVKVSDNAVWLIIVAVREYSSSLLKKIIANDIDFGCGHTPQLPNHFHTSLACHHDSLVNSVLLDGGKQIQHERSFGGEAKAETEKKGKRVIDSTSLSNVLSENLSAATRLTSMYTAASLCDRRGTSSLAGLETVKSLVNASIQKAASRRYKSSSEFEAKSPPCTTANNSARATPIHTNASPNIQPDEKHAEVLPPLTSAQLFQPTFPHSLLHRNQLQRVSPPIDPKKCSLGYLSMPFQLLQSTNHSDPILNHLGRRNSENQLAPQPILPILRPIREPLKLEEPLPQLLTNVTETPRSASPTATPKNTPASSRRGSKNLANMLTRGENEEGKPTEEEGGKDGEDNIVATTPPISIKSPASPQSRGYGVKNLAAIKARTSSAFSPEPGSK